MFESAHILATERIKRPPELIALSYVYREARGDPIT